MSSMRIVLVFLSLSLFPCSAWGGQSIDRMIEAKGTLVFENDFNRSESDDSKEELSRGWVTNSEKRAAGTKQGDLVGGFLSITMAKHANHGVSVRHDAPFDDGVIQVNFACRMPRGLASISMTRHVRFPMRDIFAILE